MREIKESEVKAFVDHLVDELCRAIAYKIEEHAIQNLMQPSPPYGRPISLHGSQGLAGSLKVYDTGKGYLVVVEAPYGAAVEYGSFPHWAPIKPLLEWAKKRFGDSGIAYAVQKSIAKKGTRAHPYFNPAIDEAIEPAIAQVIARYG